ncbi:copper resistance protein B [Croceicoccus mobilis]|uniref:Copper resistance protein B n=1 Tax=Croceicoccus mobilis TaxID=1703339 RepID=A0A916YU97_9SPHN|nr:copper resistance protein B [Croceicoccus mobilis]GGD60863.1 copper resistance protein B [Croceicoccus mobilis]
MRKTIPIGAALLLASAPAAAAAQDHDHAAPAPAADDTCPMPDHAAMGEGAMDHGAMDHGDMSACRSEADEQLMDHSGMNHSTMAGEAPIPQTPPPPEAFEGPAHAADAIVGAEKMAASRAAVAREVSGMNLLWIQGERAEYRAREGSDGYLWDIQGYYGGDIDKLWVKSEGEGNFGEKPESAEVQALWSHAIGPWWDLQAGIRQDLTGPERTHAVIGLQGLAPYLFEVDAAAFISTRGDVTARIEAELDQRITQRLILQPRAEIGLSAQDIPELGVGAGLDTVEAGLRLRYEITRQFAPYVGIEQEWKIGHGADYARAAGEDPSATNYVAGIRFWF